MRANRSMPRSTVIPVLSYPDIVKAVDWLCSTFGFTLRWRAGSHRAQLNVGDAAIAIAERRSEKGDRSRETSDGKFSVMVRVEDVDSHHEQSEKRGARILQLPADYPYGERQYTVEDLAGHVWTFSQSIADVAPEEWGATSAQI